MTALISVLFIGAQSLLLASLIPVILRLLRGPTVFDRVLCAETVLLSVVGWLLLSSAAQSERHYVDAALGLALFSFVGTVFLARYLGEGEIDD